MCRLLCVKSESEFEIKVHLEKFADISKNSKEYQGHGWGCAYLSNGEWKIYHSITPIWEDDISQFGQTTLLLAHARSAFRDEGIQVENNMPFVSGEHVFIFNGELQGVRINSPGRIGAERLFNFIMRFFKGDILEALQRSVPIVIKRTEYVRAMNFIIADKQSVHYCSLFNQEPEYFRMHELEGDPHILCSEPYDSGWKKVENDKIGVFS